MKIIYVNTVKIVFLGKGITRYCRWSNLGPRDMYRKNGLRSSPGLSLLSHAPTSSFTRAPTLLPVTQASTISPGGKFVLNSQVPLNTHCGKSSWLPHAEASSSWRFCWPSCSLPFQQLSLYMKSPLVASAFSGNGKILEIRDHESLNRCISSN